MTDVIAHRGASRAARENTLDAFRAAVRIGAHGIELDARRAADGELLVHHDAYLDGRPLVERSSSDRPAWLPTLSDALDACAGGFVNVEIKNDPSEPDFDPDETVAAAVVAELTRRADPLANWIVSSFRIETVDRCRELNPAIPTAWLTVIPPTDDHIASIAATGHAAIHPWVPTVDHALIVRCHAAGVRVNTWTCNDPDRAAELAAWGIDGICTDVPDVVLAALAAAQSEAPAKGGVDTERNEATGRP